MVVDGEQQQQQIAVLWAKVMRTRQVLCQKPLPEVPEHTDAGMGSSVDRLGADPSATALPRLAQAEVGAQAMLAAPAAAPQLAMVPDLLEVAAGKA